MSERDEEGFALSDEEADFVFAESDGQAPTEPEALEATDDSDPANTQDAPEAEQPAAEAAEATEEGEQAAKPNSATDKQNTVPHGAFHEERERRKAAEQRLDRLLSHFNAAREDQAKPADPPAPPDPNEDPIAALEWQREQVAQTQQRLQGFEQEQAQAREAAAVQQHFVAEAQAYSAEKPDFGNAYDHVHKALVRTAAISGSDNPEQAALEFERNIVKRAAATGQNSAQVFYGMASEFGYRPAPAEPATPAEPAADAAARVAQIDEGQRKHRSLSTGGGDATPTHITPDMLSKMSDAEYHQLLSDKRNRDALEAAMAAAG